MRWFASLWLLFVGGCQGYLVDHIQGKRFTLGPQLARYGLANNDCVAQRLQPALTVWQTRQLADLAERLTPGDYNPARFGPREFVYVAGLVEDPAVGSTVRRVFGDCGVTLAAPNAPAATSSASVTSNTTITTSTGTIITQGELPRPSSSPFPPREQMPSSLAALWVNLGSAQSGQGIAVDAASVTRGPQWRQAWFRLLNGNAPGASDVGYLLRINCDARTITAYGGRKYAAGGALIEQKDYPAPEGPLPVEAGTVMDVAFQSLCQGPD